MAAAQAIENYGDQWGLNCYLRWAIYTPIPTWTYSQNPLAAAEALSWKISSHRTSLKWSWRPSLSYAMKRGISFWVWRKVIGETTTWSEFPIGGKATVEQILVSEERNPKKQDYESHNQEINHQSKVEKLQHNSPGLSVATEQIRKSLWWTLNTPKTNTLADRLIERASSM